MNQKKRGFTLIELLIVVAIIAILAAIAVPNFLEAQTRSKVSRVKADMRTLATAIESYAVDFNRAFQSASEVYYSTNPATTSPANIWKAWSQLTTPVSYMTSIPKDPFFVPRSYTLTGPRGTISTVEGEHDRFFQYATFGYLYGPGATGAVGQKANPEIVANGYSWTLYSYGPASKWTLAYLTPWFPRALGCGQPGGISMNKTDYRTVEVVYDPTNGTVSMGFIIRTNKGIYDGRV